MRALVFHGAKDIRVETVADPRPDDSEVVIRVDTAGICGSDVHGYAGETGRRVAGMVMGHEASGVVEHAGSQVRGVRIGDRVTFNPVLDCGQCALCAAGRHSLCQSKRVIGVSPDAAGAFAELVAVRGSNVLRLPAALPLDLAALVEPVAVGLHAVAVSGLREGDTALVLGGGAIGITCALAARLAGGASVSVVEPVEQRRALAARLGIAVAPRVDADALPSSRLARGYDVVLDAVGIPATLRDGLAALRPGGTLVMVGMGRPELSFGLYDLVVPEKRVVGSMAYDRDDFERAVGVVAGAGSGVAAIVDRILGLDAAPAAFLDLAEHRDAAARVLVAPGR